MMKFLVGFLLGGLLVYRFYVAITEQLIPGIKALLKKEEKSENKPEQKFIARIPSKEEKEERLKNMPIRTSDSPFRAKLK